MQENNPTIGKWQAWGTLLFLSLIWGTSYILIKKGLIVFSPLEVGSIRLGIAALSFTPILIQHLKKVSRKDLHILFWIGVAGTGLPSILFPLAQQELNSSFAGILNSMTPLFTLTMGLVFFGLRFSWYKSVGIVIGLLGAVCLFAFGKDMGDDQQVSYGLYIIFACICYAASANLVGHRVKHLKAMTISAISFTMMGIPALLYLFFGTPFVQKLSTVPGAWEGLGFIVILALFSTVLAGIIFFKLVQQTSPVFGSTVSYIVPIVAILWGVFDGEVITEMHLIGMALILVGVYLSKGNHK